jgi:hypothetical protein
MDENGNRKLKVFFVMSIFYLKIEEARNLFMQSKTWHQSPKNVKLQPLKVDLTTNAPLNMWILFFWVVTPCGLIGRSQCFGETYYLLLQG